MIKTHRTKRTFSPEFKLEAIEQVVKYQRDVREVPLVMLLPLNNAKFSSLKRFEMEKEILSRLPC
ncbi:hypothetical protein ESCO106002_22730 [Escherichia coli]